MNFCEDLDFVLELVFFELRGTLTFVKENSNPQRHLVLCLSLQVKKSFFKKVFAGYFATHTQAWQGGRGEGGSLNPSSRYLKQLKISTYPWVCS